MFFSNWRLVSYSRWLSFPEQNKKHLNQVYSTILNQSSRNFPTNHSSDLHTNPSPVHTIPTWLLCHPLCNLPGPEFWLRTTSPPVSPVAFLVLFSSQRKAETPWKMETFLKCLWTFLNHVHSVGLPGIHSSNYSYCHLALTVDLSYCYCVQKSLSGCS